MITKAEQILKRDILFNEITKLRNDQKRIEKELKEKEKELEDVCPCLEKEGYEYSVCIHCGKWG